MVVRCLGVWSRVAGEVVELMKRLDRHPRFRRADAPVLWRAIRDPWLTTPSETLRELYLPLRPR